MSFTYRYELISRNIFVWKYFFFTLQCLDLTKYFTFMLFFPYFFSNYAVLLNLNLQDPETLGTLGYDLLLLLLCSEDTPRECAKSLDFAKKQFSFKWSFQRSELCKSSYILNHPSEISNLVLISHLLLEKLKNLSTPHFNYIDMKYSKPKLDSLQALLFGHFLKLYINSSKLNFCNVPKNARQFWNDFLHLEHCTTYLAKQILETQTPSGTLFLH